MGEHQNVAILARIYFETGDHDTCLTYLNQITVPAEFSINLDTDYYARLLMLQVVSMKIIIALARGQKKPADEISWFRKGIESKFFEPIFHYSAWYSFVEDLLYRLVFVTYKDEECNPWTVIQYCRMYLQLGRFIPLEFFPWKRISLLRFYLRFLVQHFRGFFYEPPVFYISNTSILAPQSLNEELSMLLSLYEHLVTSNASYPKAGKASLVIEQLYDDISLFYAIMSPMESSVEIFSRWSAMAAIPTGSKEEEKAEEALLQTNDHDRAKTPAAMLKKLRRRRFPKAPLNPMHLNPSCSWAIFLDSMYRAAQFTFRSRALLRTIGFIAACLESVDESITAFKTYLEKDKKEKLGDWQKGLPPSVSIDFSPMISMSVSNMNPNEERRWWETSVDLLSVLVAAAKVSFDAYQVQIGLSFAERAVELSKETIKTSGKWLAPLSYYYLGLGYSLLGCETLEPEHYFHLQDQGYIMLREAQRLDSENYKFRYSLALEAAQLGHIKLALDEVKYALKLNMSYINSWHLMAILSSIQTPGDNETELSMAWKALKVCKLATESIVAGRVVNGASLGNVIPKTSLEDYINLKLTELLLVETIMNNPLLNNKKYASNSKQNDKTDDAVKDIKRMLISHDLIASYRQLFDLYNKTYYFNKTGDAIRKDTPLFSTNVGTSMRDLKINRTLERGTLERGTMERGSTPAPPEVSLVMPMYHVLQDLSTNPHPMITTLYPTVPPASDPYGVGFSSTFFPSGADPVSPLHHSLYLRRKKMRYIEIWTQLAKVFRRAGKMKDAHMACVEAQKGERGNADIEFELGLICLFSPFARAKAERTSDIPFTVPPDPSEQSMFNTFASAKVAPTTLFMVENNVQPFPDVMSANYIPLSPKPPGTFSSGSDENCNSGTLEDNINKAIVHFLSALTYDEEHMFARTWLGRCYWLQGRLELARAELERAAKGGRIRGHKIWHTCHQLALVYQSLNMEGKASEWFASALKHQSTAVPLTMLRGFEVLPHVL